MTNARKRTSKPATGVILWEGPSPEDGQPIVAVLTFESSNRKTGNIPQVWILRSDMSPADAVSTGWDESICGQCPHRRDPETGARSCYVDLGKAPLSVWRSFRAGRYPSLAQMGAATVAKRIGGRPIRWGAYGDPAMIPAAVVAATQSLTTGGHRGYTHQWRKDYASWARTWFMASCDGLLDYVDASTSGWRTFRVAAVGHRPEAGRQCPATVTGSVAQCRSCTQCDAQHGHIWVEAHGQGAKHVQQ